MGAEVAGNVASFEPPPAGKSECPPIELSEVPVVDPPVVTPKVLSDPPEVTAKDAFGPVTRESTLAPFVFPEEVPPATRAVTTVTRTATGVVFALVPVSVTTY